MSDKLPDLSSDGTKVKDVVKDSSTVEISGELISVISELTDRLGDISNFSNEEIVKIAQRVFDGKLITPKIKSKSEEIQEKIQKQNEDHYKFIKSLEKDKEKLEKDKARSLKSMAGGESATRKLIEIQEKNPIARMFKTKMFDFKKGISDSIKSTPILGGFKFVKDMANSINPEMQSQKDISRLKEVGDEVDNLELMIKSVEGDSPEQIEARAAFEEELKKLKKEESEILSRTGQPLEQAEELEKIEMQKIARETLVQTNILEEISQAIKNEEGKGDERNQNLIDQLQSEKESTEEQLKKLDKAFRESGDKSQTEDQESLIAAQKAKSAGTSTSETSMDRVKEAKVEDSQSGGFWGFLALTGMAIGALVGGALAPFVVYLKSRLDIIKELMPDEMLNKISELFESVKTKFADIKVSILEKIDNIKEWFSNLKDNIIKKLEPVVAKFDDLKSKIVKKFEPVTNFINSIGDLFGKADKASPTLFQRMTKFLGMFDGIFGFFRGFFKGFNFVFLGLFRTLSKIPFIGQIIDFAVGIFKGFREGLDGLDLIVSGLAQVVAGGIGGTFDLLIDGLNWVFGLFGFDFKKSLGLGEDFSLEEMIRTGLMELVDFLSDLTNIKDLLKNIVPDSMKSALSKVPGLGFLAEKSVEDKAEEQSKQQQTKVTRHKGVQKMLSKLPKGLQERYNRDITLIRSDIIGGIIKRNKDGSLEYIDPKDRGKGKSGARPMGGLDAESLKSITSGQDSRKISELEKIKNSEQTKKDIDNSMKSGQGSRDFQQTNVRTGDRTSITQINKIPQNQPVGRKPVAVD